MSWYGKRSCSRPAFLRSFGSWYQHDRTALSSIWCLWFHHRLQRLGQTPRVKPCTLQSPSRIKVDFWVWKRNSAMLVGISTKTCVLPLPCYFAGRKNWNHPLSAVKMCKNPTEEDLSEIQETVVEILEVERVDAIRLDLLNSFHLIWFDANGEYFRGFDNPACVPPIFTSDVIVITNITAWFHGC